MINKDFIFNLYESFFQSNIDFHSFIDLLTVWEIESLLEHLSLLYLLIMSLIYLVIILKISHNVSELVFN